jgi:plasmid stability protein
MDSVTAIRYDIPDDLHRALKIRAAELGIPLKELVVQLLTDALRVTA